MRRVLKASILMLLSILLVAGTMPLTGQAKSQSLMMAMAVIARLMSARMEWWLQPIRLRQK